MGDLRGKTHDEMLKCPDFKKAYKLGNDISDLVKNFVRKNRSKTHMDFDYIIKTAVILFMAEMFSNLSKNEADSLKHFEQVVEQTAKIIHNAYEFKKAH